MFQAWTGVLTAGWNTYSNTMISEVVPAPKMYLFFSLFFIVGKTSSFVGPFIASAIINDADGNTSASFWWTFFSGVVGLGLLALVDVKKAKVACAECEYPSPRVQTGRICCADEQTSRRRRRVTMPVSTPHRVKTVRRSLRRPWRAVP